MGERRYDPTLGRSTRPDPSPPDSTDYTYAGGDPANFADPGGTRPLLVACAGGAARSVVAAWAVARSAGNSYFAPKGHGPTDKTKEPGQKIPLYRRLRHYHRRGMEQLTS